VELLARGVDEQRRAALRSLERGDPLAAREHALALLREVPNSPAGLAILVDACEALWLDDEAVEALQKLCESAPWRGELWVRLAEGLLRLKAPASEVTKALENALEPDMDPSSRRRALLLLADMDLEREDAWRATRWLDALRFHDSDPEIGLRRLELALMLGDRNGIAESLRSVGQPGTLDGRGSLAVGRGRWQLGEPMALDLLIRALLLEARGAEEALAALLAGSHDVVEVKRIREVLQALGIIEEPRFSFSLAMAEGREQDARRELVRIARAGDIGAARTLVDVALERKDVEALAAAVDVLGARAPSVAAAIVGAYQAWREGRGQEALTTLDSVTEEETSAGKMAHWLRVQVFGMWLRDGEDGSFQRLIDELRKAASFMDRLDLVGACEALVVESKRPLRVAVVGEFNAGKSSFINAVVGADVAPTGVLPTTASLHWLSWAPDPYARIVTREDTDRIVTHEGLKGALAALQKSDTPIREVHICAPIERLYRIEILDTPGFNAPDMDHVAAATRAVHEAHVAIWVLDATQALKDSERKVLARIADVGTPVQIFINKLDRLTPEKLQQVMGHVQTGLASIGLESMAWIVAFSARLALAGRLGDVQSMQASRWQDVETLLSQQIENRSGTLRARALRRKASRIATELSELMQQQDAAPKSHREAREWEASASRLLSLERTQYERIVQRLEPATARVREDLRPIRVAGMSMDDINASAYAEARLLVRMTQPMASAIAEVAEVHQRFEPEIRDAVGLVLRGTFASAKSIDDFLQFPSWRVVRACALASHERIVVAGERAAGAVAAHPRWMRLQALRESLTRD